MGFFDFVLRCALVVAYVVADGGGSRGDEHRKNNVEIGLGNGGLIASFSEPRARGVGFAGPGKFSGPDHGSLLHGSGGDIGHDRLTNNEIVGSFGDHGVAGQLENHGNVRDIGHDFDGVDGGDGFTGAFGGGVTQLHNVFGGQNFGGVGDRSNSGINGGFESDIAQGQNIQDNVHDGRSTFTGSHGAGHAGGPFIIQGKGIRFGGAHSRQGHSFAGRQGSAFASSHRGFGVSLQGSQDSKLFGTGSGIGIGRGHGTSGGKFEGFSGDLGRGQLNVHESNLGEGIFEMLEGEKLVGFDAGVVDGHLQPLAGRSHQSFSSGIPGVRLSNFGAEIGGNFRGHDNLQGSIGSGLSSSGGIGHGKLGDNRNEIKSGSFGNVVSFGKNSGFEGGNEHFSEIQDHGPSSGLNFNSGSDFGAKDEFRGQGAVIKGGVGHGTIGHQTGHIASSGGGGFSHQSSFLGDSSLGGSSSGLSDDKLRRDIHSGGSGSNLGGSRGGKIEAGVFGDSGGKLRGSVHHAGFRGDNIDGVSGGSLHDFVGGDAFGGVHGGKASSFASEGRDGGSIGGFGSSIGNEGKVGGSIGGFGSSPIHGGKEDGGIFEGFGSSIGHGGKVGGSIGGFGGSIVHGGKEDGGSFGDFSSSLVHGGKGDGSSFGGFGSSKVHGGKGGGSIGGFGGSIVQEGKIDAGSFGVVGTSPVHEGKGVGSFGGFGGGVVHGGKEDGGSFGGNTGHGGNFNLGGIDQHAIVGGVGGGNFFGYKEDDFLASKDAVDFTGGLAGGFGGGHGARVVSYDGHEVHVGSSGLGGFGGALSGKDGGHGGFGFNSGFTGSSAGGHGGVLAHGRAVGSPIKAGHGGGFQNFDGADNLSNFGGVIGGKGFGDIGGKGFGDIGSEGFGDIGGKGFGDIGGQGFGDIGGKGFGDIGGSGFGDIGGKGFGDIGGKGFGDIGGKGFGDIGGKGFGDIGGRGFGDIGVGDFDGPIGFEGGKFDGPGATDHGGDLHAFTEEKSAGIGGGIKGSFGDDKSQVRKFGGVVDVHDVGSHGRGAGSSVGGGHGKGKLVIHQPGNPYGINGSE